MDILLLMLKCNQTLHDTGALTKAQKSTIECQPLYLCGACLLRIVLPSIVIHISVRRHGPLENQCLFTDQVIYWSVIYK